MDEIHNNATLAEFWRHGALVVNPATEIPIHADIVDPTGVVPRAIKENDCYHFYALDTSLDPEKRPGRGRDVYEEGGAIEQQSVFRVFVMAHVLGEKPDRRWLLYGHAPRGDEKEVEVNIPDYGKVTFPVAQAGSYYEVRERDKTARPVK
ncbi:MAG: hypothetical protein FJ290_22730 [Planctomycetes bacterium]|nr:hypothetical protein [Planctomycetota bacterium]